MRVRRRGALWGVVFILVMFLLPLLVIPARALSISGNQVLTLEAGSDGLWLTQAWTVECQITPRYGAAVVYDVWRHSSDALTWGLLYRQADVSVTWLRDQPATWPISATAGCRWHMLDNRDSPSKGPWYYGMVVIGW